MLGKLVHIGFDALLISAFLAGVKRNTGLTYATPCWLYPSSSSHTPLLCSVDPSCQRFQTRTCDVSDLACLYRASSLTISNRTTKLISRIWCVRGPVDASQPWMNICFDAGEYVFDFAVVVFGVSPLHSAAVTSIDILLRVQRSSSFERKH